MTYATFLSLLDSPRPMPARAGTVSASIAYCPAHQRQPHNKGRTRKLSVAETATGAVLVHCHRGCSAHDVVGALGLNLADLYPPPDMLRQMMRGNGGPAAWASAYAAAGEAQERLIEALVIKDADRLLAAVEALTAFRQVARAAMRTGNEVRDGN